MKSLTMYQIDSFSDTLFRGNPAAICPLKRWLPDRVLQDIAAENNLSETGFYVRKGDSFHIRWFTPVVEVDLCGHATLAASYVIFKYDKYKKDAIVFSSRSGRLTVRREKDLLVMDFPVDEFRAAAPPAELVTGVGKAPLETYRGKTDYMAVYASQKDIEAVRPDFGVIAKIPARGVIVTARGEDVDFVSRFFGPQSGVAEDPVTGSAHTTLTPYWAARLGKNELHARQCSSRGGELRCRLAGDRVLIGGKATPYLVGKIFIGE